LKKMDRIINISGIISERLIIWGDYINIDSLFPQGFMEVPYKGRCDVMGAGRIPVSDYK